jgi:hypothetical protein
MQSTYYDMRRPNSHPLNTMYPTPAVCTAALLFAVCKLVDSEPVAEVFIIKDNTA